MSPVQIAVAACLTVLLGASAAWAQTSIEQRIERNNSDLNTMMQRQQDSRQNQIDNSGLRQRLDNDRIRTPNYPNQRGDYR